MTLHELAERERAVLETKVYPATGPMKEKWQQLAAVGAFQDYREIHRAYVELISDAAASTEALKSSAVHRLVRSQ